MILPQVKPWDQEQKRKLCRRLGFYSFDWNFVEITDKKIVRAMRFEKGRESFVLTTSPNDFDENTLVLERPNFETLIPETPSEVAWLSALLPYPYNLILVAGSMPFIHAQGKLLSFCQSLQGKIRSQSEEVTKNELAIIQFPTLSYDSEVLTVVYQFVQKKQVNLGWWDMTQYPIEDLFTSLQEKKLGVKTTYLSLAI
jgi:hypothetical protein